MEIISTKQARAHFSEVINKVAFGGERYTLTRHGNEVAVLIAPDEWKAIENLLQTIEDDEDIREADAAYAKYLKNGGIPFSKVKKDLGLK